MHPGGISEPMLLQGLIWPRRFQWYFPPLSLPKSWSKSALGLALESRIRIWLGALDLRVVPILLFLHSWMEGSLSQDPVRWEWDSWMMFLWKTYRKPQHRINASFHLPVTNTENYLSPFPSVPSCPVLWPIAWHLSHLYETELHISTFSPSTVSNA